MVGKLCIALTFCTNLAAAQPAVATTGASSAKTLAFETVSIRPTHSDSKPSFGPTPDGFRITNLPLIGLFQLAYIPTATGDSGFFRGARISGAPDWLSHTERYDVVAKVAEPDIAEWQKPTSQPKMLRAMMQALLTDRLNAAAHIQNKEMPVFDLVVAKSGPKFKPAETVDSAELRTKHRGAIIAPDGSAIAPGTNMSQMNFFGASLATLTPILSYLSGRPVQDKTGLTGKYDFTIQMSFNSLGPALDNATAKAGSPEDSLPPPPPPPGMESNAATSAANSEPAIFTVVQEQLGLRLEPAKGQVETLVIDHVKHPTEN